MQIRIWNEIKFAFYSQRVGFGRHILGVIFSGVFVYTVLSPNNQRFRHLFHDVEVENWGWEQYGIISAAVVGGYVFGLIEALIFVKFNALANHFDKAALERINGRAPQLKMPMRAIPKQQSNNKEGV